MSLFIYLIIQLFEAEWVLHDMGYSYPKIFAQLTLTTVLCWIGGNTIDCLLTLPRLIFFHPINWLHLKVSFH